MPEGQATKTARSEPTPDANGSGSEVGRRLAELRETGAASPEEARDATWRWFHDLGDEVRRDRDGGTAKLNELFRSGTPPAGIDGQTEGILVAPLIAGRVDGVLRGITGLWMPWQGKRFMREEGRGDNVLAGSARWPAKLFWPLYGTKPMQGGRAAFDFQTRVEPSEDDADVQVLVIDYSVMDSNPRFLIKSIRDELVEIMPGANLGKVLWRHGDGHHSLIGFFALRTSV
jgi:hypothetical protein